MTPQHSQFIACRKGRGVGLWAGGSRRAAEGSEEAAGDKGWHRLALFIPPYLSSEGYIHLEEPLPSMDGEEPLHREAGRALGDTPTPPALWICSPELGCQASSGDQQEPDLSGGDGPQPRVAGPGPEKKTHATKRGGTSGRPTPHDRDGIWLFGQLTLAGGLGGWGKRDSGRGFI